jgi:hypothetical protein
MVRDRGCGTWLAGGVLMILSCSSCSAPDPSSVSFVERPSEGSSSGSPGPRPKPTDGKTPEADASAPSVDGGPAVDPVFGSTAFSYMSPGVNANGASNAHSGTVEGKDCLMSGCHGSGSNRAWVFGGTVYSASTGGTVVSKAEIRIVGPNGAEVGKAYTDANGNFWFSQAGTTIPAGSRVGVRKEGGIPRAMNTPLQADGGACSRASCHGANGTGRVFAP